MPPAGDNDESIAVEKLPDQHVSMCDQPSPVNCDLSHWFTQMVVTPEDDGSPIRQARPYHDVSAMGGFVS